MAFGNAEREQMFADLFEKASKRQRGSDGAGAIASEFDETGYGFNNEAQLADISNYRNPAREAGETVYQQGSIYTPSLRDRYAGQEAPLNVKQRTRIFLNDAATRLGDIMGQDYSLFLNPPVNAPGSR